jgi:hypothetical protein
MFLTAKRSPRSLWVLALTGALGCSEMESVDQPPDYSKAVPAGGIVTVNGQALPSAIVTFYPPKWAAASAVTDENGRYDLKIGEMYHGVLPGGYRVSISHRVSPDGSLLTPDQLLSFPPPPSKEVLPPEYSSPNATTLKKTVGPQGGTFDFNLEVPGFKPGVKKEPPPEDKAAPEANAQKE